MLGWNQREPDGTGEQLRVIESRLAAIEKLLPQAWAKVGPSEDRMQTVETKQTLLDSKIQSDRKWLDLLVSRLDNIEADDPIPVLAKKIAELAAEAKELDRGDLELVGQMAGLEKIIQTIANEELPGLDSRVGELEARQKQDSEIVSGGLPGFAHRVEDAEFLTLRRLSDIETRLAKLPKPPVPAKPTATHRARHGSARTKGRLRR